MNRKAAAKHKDVIIAFGEGKEIECKQTYLDGRWMPSSTPSFSESFEYRVKPQPIRIVAWVDAQTGEFFRVLMEDEAMPLGTMSSTGKYMVKQFIEES